MELKEFYDNTIFKQESNKNNQKDTEIKGIFLILGNVNNQQKQPALDEYLAYAKEINPSFSDAYELPKGHESLISKLEKASRGNHPLVIINNDDVDVRFSTKDKTDEKLMLEHAESWNAIATLSKTSYVVIKANAANFMHFVQNLEGSLSPKDSPINPQGFLNHVTGLATVTKVRTKGTSNIFTEYLKCSVNPIQEVIELDASLNRKMEILDTIRSAQGFKTLREQIDEFCSYEFEEEPKAIFKEFLQGRNGLTLISGFYGTGKTVLANGLFRDALQYGKRGLLISEFETSGRKNKFVGFGGVLTDNSLVRLPANEAMNVSSGKFEKTINENQIDYIYFEALCENPERREVIKFALELSKRYLVVLEVALNGNHYDSATVPQPEILQELVGFAQQHDDSGVDSPTLQEFISLTRAIFLTRFYPDYGNGPWERNVRSMSFPPELSRKMRDMSFLSIESMQYLLRELFIIPAHKKALEDEQLENNQKTPAWKKLVSRKS